MCERIFGLCYIRLVVQYQGFLESSKIEIETTYNFKVHLSRISPLPPLPYEALEIDPNRRTSIEAGLPREVMAYSKVRPATLRVKRNRVLWKSEGMRQYSR